VNEKTIFSIGSDHQQIRLTRGPRGLSLYLDGIARVSEDSEGICNVMLVTLPVAMSWRVGRGLIVGGGDGLAARNAIRAGVTNLTVFEKDPAILALAKTPPLSVLAAGSLSDPRVKTYIGDAKTAARQFRGGIFDLIVSDGRVGVAEAGALAAGRIAPGGVFATRILDDGVRVEDMRKCLEASLGNSFTITGTSFRGYPEAFIYGSRQPLLIRRPFEGFTVAAGKRIRDALTSRQRVLNYVEVSKGKANALPG
jgi:hypothetical protein